MAAAHEFAGGGDARSGGRPRAARTAHAPRRAGRPAWARTAWSAATCCRCARVPHAVARCHQPSSTADGAGVTSRTWQDAKEPTVFVARKIFRGARGLEAHEGSEHYRRWVALALADGGSGPMVKADSPQLLDTLHPRSSPQPFLSGWKTA
eukprot:1960605-Prymnesium_polylepis.2